MKFTEDLSEIVSEISVGGIVCFPTDTLFALSCAATDKDAVEKLYRIKKRPKDKKLPVFFKNIDHVKEHCIFNDIASRLAEKFWPGPLTMVLELRDDSIMRSIYDTESLAVRIPNASHILEIIREVKAPLVGTSANISGMENPLSYDELCEQFLDSDVTLLKMKCELSGVQSTIVSFEGGKVDILREGVIPRLDIMTTPI